MKLYNYYRSSASFRVRIGLYWKNLKFEYIPVHLVKDGGQQHSSSYREICPMEQVPAFEHDGQVLTESMAILQYLDAIHPEPGLFPNAALAKARVLEICEIINAGIQPLQNLKLQQFLENEWQIEKEKSNAFVRHWMHRGLAALEKVLARTSDVYSYGHTFTAADCLVIPQCFTAKRFNVEIEAYPNLLRVFENGRKLPAVIKAEPANQPDFQGAT